MRRVWLGLFVGVLVGLTGCRAMPSARHIVERPSGVTDLILSLPEPGETWHESHRPPDRTRVVRRGRGSSSPIAVQEIPPRGEGDPTALAVTVPGGLESGFDKLRPLNPAQATPAVALPGPDGPFRAITEADVRTLATGRSPSAYRMELENLIPASHGGPNGEPATSPCVDSFLRRARELAAAAERIRAVNEAASTFYQLAESEGRAELMRAGLTAFDDMRAEAGKPMKRVVNGRVVDIPAPDLSGIDGQRGQMLETASQLMFLVRKLNIDLKQQTGLAGDTGDRLYPTGEFGVDPTPLNVPAQVREAMENRPDLQLLRLAYYELNEDTLPAIRDQLRQSVGLLNAGRLIAPRCRHRPLLATALERFGRKPCVDPALAHELAVRKAQLYDLICEKEREAADQVRTACLYRDTAAELVGLARYRSEEARKKVDAAKAAKAAPVLEFPLLFEWYKARADVIQAVMNWHQAGVKLRAATGRP